jgi:molybdopterin molybdotransferase
VQRPVKPERQSIAVAQARRLILDSVQPLGSETVGLLQAAGRVLAEDVRATRNIPPEDNSAMDGFAVRAVDTIHAPVELRVIDDLPAGRRPQRPIGAGEAARIMTGGVIPPGADAVVMIEDTEPAGAEHVRVRAAAEPGQHLRRAGADVRPGTPIASPGTLLRPALIGMLASIGRTAVQVTQRPRVAVLATGDELVEPDRLLDDGRIVSSNSYNLQAALLEIGAQPVYLGIAPDEPAQIEARFRQALACDAVISTGGVSVGDRDWIKQVLADLGGQLRLWRVNMKPGAPLAFVMVEGRPVFGLPGNPVSTLVAFEQFVRPALLRMMGHRRVFRPVCQAVLAEDYSKPAGRLHFVRVRLQERAGAACAVPTGDQASNLLLSMVRADGLAIVEAEATRVAAGSPVPVQLIGRDDLREVPGF